MPKFSRLVQATILCSFVSACFWETTDASYDTAAEAIDSGVMGKGWIPEWLPQDAIDLREVHSVDSNVSELSFSTPHAKLVRLPADCRPVEYSDTVQAYIRRSWWPSEEVLQQSYTFFRCPADFTDYKFVAISKTDNRVLHWRTYAR